MGNKAILTVKQLKTYFYTEQGMVKAVDGVDFHVDKAETLGIVGESGCGKSVTSLSIMRLISFPPGKIVGGHIRFKDKDLLSLKESEMRQIRGNDISMIFQEPMTSLNPVFTVGSQIAEAIMLHQQVNRKEALNRAEDMLRAVSIPDPRQRLADYPHNMSGGMRQRVMIAMALSCNPAILIADEPTTALDVTIQAQILDLIQQIQEQYDLSIIIITHDLSIIAEIADRVVVMYAGKIIEQGSVEDIFKHPCHPYTQGLLQSIPRLHKQTENKELYTIPGMVPDPLDLPTGCYFAPRCPQRQPVCLSGMPEFVTIDNQHKVRCVLYGDN